MTDDAHRDDNEKEELVRMNNKKKDSKEEDKKKKIVAFNATSSKGKAKFGESSDDSKLLW